MSSDEETTDLKQCQKDKPKYDKTPTNFDEEYIDSCEQLIVKSTERTLNPYYYHKDQLGSVIAITDKSGMMVEKYRYDAYGKPYVWNVVKNRFVAFSVSKIGNERMFTGREYENRIKLYYYRARFYSSNLGRFISRDPIGVKDNINLYTYVQNNPLRYIDPMGLEKTIIGTMRIYSDYDDPNKWQDGHSWVEFTTKAGVVITFGTGPLFGKLPLNEEWQMGDDSDILVNRERDNNYAKMYENVSVFAEKELNTNQMKTAADYINQQMASGRKWTPDSPCSSFTSDVWNQVSDYKLSDTDNGSWTHNPDNLAKHIREYNSTH